jgi:hypothetical protein
VRFETPVTDSVARLVVSAFRVTTLATLVTFSVVKFETPETVRDVKLDTEATLSVVEFIIGTTIVSKLKTVFVVFDVNPAVMRVFVSTAFDT